MSYFCWVDNASNAMLFSTASSSSWVLNKFHKSYLYRKLPIHAIGCLGASLCACLAYSSRPLFTFTNLSFLNLTFDSGCCGKHSLCIVRLTPTLSLWSSGTKLCTLTTPEKRSSKGQDVEEEEGGLLSKLIFALANLIRISQTLCTAEFPPQFHLCIPISMS